MSKLPSGWIPAPLRDITLINPKHSGETKPDLLVSFVPMRAVSATGWQFLGVDVRRHSEVRKGFTHFADGDVLLAKITPCFENGKAAIARGLKNGLGCGTTELLVLRPLGGIKPEYLYHYLHQESFRNSAVGHMSGAVGQLRVPLSYIEELRFPLPPLSEQRRIVAKLEELLGKVDACQMRLAKVARTLKRFRQSVLAAACSGRLTEDWREAHGKLESGRELLKRIDDKRISINASKKKSSPSSQKSDTVFAVPQSWVLTTPDRLAAPVRHALAIGPFGSNLKVSDYTTAGVPLVFVRHIRSGDFRGGNPKFVSPAKAKELAAHAIKALDLLITKMGEPPGDCEIYPEGSPDAIITADCIKFRVWEEFIERLFVKYTINSNVIKGQLGLITKGVAQQKISLERFKTLLLPVPPLAEQNEIVRRVEALFKLADQIEARYAAAKENVDQLTQSILLKAFRGELVPQDPKDEPASKLLERIRNKESARALAATR